MQDFVVGIDLGGTTSKLALVTLQGTVLLQWHIQTNTEANGAYIMANIIASLKAQIAAQSHALASLAGIGMGSPGSINRITGEVTGAYNLGWHTSQPVRRQLQAAFGDIPVVVENDANVAAVGEHVNGAGAKVANMVLVTLGTGVGGGIIADGRLLIGEGAAGEIGHMVVNPAGIKCTCGSIGCLETIASATGIVATAKLLAQISQAESALLANLQAGEYVSAYDVFQAAEAGDAFAWQVLDETMTYLAMALSQIAVILHPKCILLGGGVANAGQFLLDIIQPKFKNCGYPAIAQTTEIKLATLGNDAGVIGAAALVINQLSQNKL